MRWAKIIIILFWFASPGRTQDFGWWNELVKWDGVSHWSEYLTYTPRYFGPNALPIPEIKNGRLHSDSQIEMGAMAHYGKGDKTQNIVTRLFYPIAANKVGLQLYIVPLERYAIDAQTRDLRKARDFDGKGWAVGDVHLSTWIQIFSDRNEWDGLLTINLKTASGSNRAATRYTDGSGYNFDFSAGKSKGAWRPYAQVGFYVWETNDDKNPQNDAFSFGIGTDYTLEKWTFNTQLGGYLGYKGDGDKPMAFRASASHGYSKSISLNINLAYGINDNLFNSFGFSIIRKWKSE